MTGPTPIVDGDHLARVLAAPRAVLLLHSPRCPSSAWALHHVEAFAAAHPGALVGVVDVVACAPLAAALEAATGVPHASPQVLLLENGYPVWHARHGEVRERAMARAWAAGEER